MLLIFSPLPLLSFFFPLRSNQTPLQSTVKMGFGTIYTKGTVSYSLSRSSSTRRHCPSRLHRRCCSSYSSSGSYLPYHDRRADMASPPRTTRAPRPSRLLPRPTVSRSTTLMPTPRSPPSTTSAAAPWARSPPSLARMASLCLRPSPSRSTVRTQENVYFCPCIWCAWQLRVFSSLCPTRPHSMMT